MIPFYKAESNALGRMIHSSSALLIMWRQGNPSQKEHIGESLIY